MSACTAIWIFLYVRVSNATTVLGATTLASNVKTTSTLPSDFSGVNVVDAVISLPSARTAFPVSLSISVPLTVYSLPGSRFV